MSLRHSLAVLASAIVVPWLACAPAPPTAPPSQLGPENCRNGVDDNGDKKTDCADPLCFKNAACAPAIENCVNGADDDGDGLIDCADADCDADSSCGTTGTETGQCNDGVDNDNDGFSDCLDPDCAGAPNCGSSGIEAGHCNDGLDNDNDGFTDCADVSDCNGAPCGTGCSCAAGAKKETNCSDSADNDADGKTDCTDPDCSGVSGCGTVNSEVGKCNDGLDNDNDGLTDCQDQTDCNGAACGSGCACASGAKKETSCSDGADNDSDSKTDCADPDCLGAGTENCTDGIDNTCDRAVDCGDLTCAGNPACASLSDGKPCTTNSQCAGGKCLTEAAAGVPNGACSNATACSVSAQTGCNGGICVASTPFNVCREKCSGTGLTTPGKCRQGFACLDADTITSNSNNHCEPLCTADSDCTGSGATYGCNPWSHLCESKDKGLLKYGAACTNDSQCETNRCALGKPGGYCIGLCNGVTKACGGVGACYYYAAYGDNVGACLQGCASTSNCRGTPYSCLNEGMGTVCWCRIVDQACVLDSDCCSGSCNPYYGWTCDP